MAAIIPAKQNHSLALKVEIMRFSFIVLVFICFHSCDSALANKDIVFADNQVIAHRGAWKAKELPENSIASLKHAIELNCAGSEFDVRMTKDNVLIVTHDPTYNNLDVEESTYKELAVHLLPNGESLPTLKEYILAGMSNNNTTGLVCEIKPSKIKPRNIEITNKVMALVKELNAEPYISYYISFSYEILKRIEEIDANSKTQYLDGSKPPKEIKQDGIDGLDYLGYKFTKQPEWIKEAKDLNLILNVWTINNTEDIDWFLANEFDYITTNEPELVFERINLSPKSN